MKVTTVCSVVLVVAGFSSGLPVDRQSERDMLDIDSDSWLVKRLSFPKFTLPKFGLNKVDPTKVDVPTFNFPKTKTPPKTTEVTPPATKIEDPAPTTKKEDPAPTTQKEDPDPTTKKEDPVATTKKQDPAPTTRKEHPSSNTTKEDPAPTTKKEHASSSKKDDPAPTTKAHSQAHSAKPTRTSKGTKSSAAPRPSASSCRRKRADRGGSSSNNNNNDCDDSNMITLRTPDNRSVKFKLGRRIGFGTGSNVFEVNCGTDSDCRAMGSVVVKEYKPGGDYVRESGALRKFGELKASGKHAGKEYAVIVKQDGTKFQKTAAYQGTQEKTEGRKQVVEDAIRLATDKGTDYINRFGIMHKDNQWGNVLFGEAGGRLTSANLVDWEDYADISEPPRERGDPTTRETAISMLGDEMRKGFEMFLED